MMLAAVLSAQWGTYGGIPQQASFAIHALIIRHYLDKHNDDIGLVAQKLDIGKSTLYKMIQRGDIP